MDENQTIGSPDNDLQQAIDNISNSTNSDPVFSDPAAPPSADGNFGDPNGPFPLPDAEATIGVVTEAPEPMAPLDPIDLPDLSVSGENPADANVVTKPGFADFENQDQNFENNDFMSQTPDNFDSSDFGNNQGAFVKGEPTDFSNNFSDSPNENGNNFSNPSSHGSQGAPDNSFRGNDSSENSFRSNRPSGNNRSENHYSRPNDFRSSAHSQRTSGASNARQIKAAALRELTPLLGRLSVEPSQKFKICQDIFEDLHDYSVLDQAYQAASDIQNDDERANSLLYLIESIDAM